MEFVLLMKRLAGINCPSKTEGHLSKGLAVRVYKLLDAFLASSVIFWEEKIEKLLSAASVLNQSINLVSYILNAA